MVDQPYRAPLPVEPDPYAIAWTDLRRRRKWTWAAVVSLLIAISLQDALGSLPCIVALGVVLLLGQWLQVFRCPRCRDRGEARTQTFWWFSRACGHCGVDVGTPKWEAGSVGPPGGAAL